MFAAVSSPEAVRTLCIQLCCLLHHLCCVCLMVPFADRRKQTPQLPLANHGQKEVPLHAPPRALQISHRPPLKQASHEAGKSPKRYPSTASPPASPFNGGERAQILPQNSPTHINTADVPHSTLHPLTEKQHIIKTISTLLI